MAYTFNEHAGGEKIADVHKKPPAKKSNFRSILSLARGKFTRISVKEKLFFVQQLGIMIQTGISLAVALKTLIQQTKNKNFKAILEDVESGVERGNLFSDGLDKYRNVFSELFINMIRAGEQTGKLEEVLKQLFVQMKKDHDIVSKVRSAMIYPSIVITAMILIGTMVVVYVIPNLMTIFKEMNAELPLATRILLKISDFITVYGLYLIILSIVGAITLLRVIHIPQGKFIYHRILISTPILGGIIKKINLARFCRTLSSLLKTDIAIVSSCDITSKVLGNELYKRALLSAKEKIKKGTTIHDSLSPYGALFPPVILQMVSVGEETGALDTILEQSAAFFEDEVDQTMKNLPTIIEPVLILILGLGVAGMAVAVIMPLYSLANQI